jgi:enoyl-CoA hydratase/carnithine racemase
MSDAWNVQAGDGPVILAEVREGVGVITLNRPSRLNAWTPLMGTLYFDALERFARDPEVRAILVTGAGRAFCSGADVSGLTSMSDAGGLQPERELRPYWYPIEIGKPVVAAIKGVCYGVGLQQALFCDVRFVSEDVRISTAYARRGLVGEVGSTWIISRIVGASRALDLMLTARVVEAREALALGLAHYVAPTDSVFDAAFAYCAGMARESSPWSMRMMKLQVYADLMDSLPPAFDRSQALLDVALAGPDLAEFVRAFKEKRPPAFPGLDPALAQMDPCGRG